jgi:hypothetical protein
LGDGIEPRRIRILFSKIETHILDGSSERGGERGRPVCSPCDRWLVVIQF